MLSSRARTLAPVTASWAKERLFEKPGATEYKGVNSCAMESAVKDLVTRLVREDEGQDLIEYGLLIGIITVAAITAI